MDTTVGTREAKDIIIMNDGIKVGDVVCKICRDGNYGVFQNKKEIMRTSKIDIVLDWMVEEGYLYETRFRLTAHQKDMLRQRIWEFIGTTIMMGIASGIGLVILMAWLLGIGC